MERVHDTQGGEESEEEGQKREVGGGGFEQVGLKSSQDHVTSAAQ